MKSKIDIIIKNVTKGNFTDCLANPDTRCLNSMQQESLYILNKEGLSAYNDLVKKIYNLEKIKNNYTVKHVENFLNLLITENVQHESSITQRDIENKINEKLPTEGIKTFDIYRNIFGINLSDKFKKIEPFVFQEGDNVYEDLFNENTWKDNPLKESLSRFVVRYAVGSVTNERALEIADVTFENLEYLFAFIVGNKHTRYEVRVLRPTKENLLFYMMKSHDGDIALGSSRENPVYDQIDLNSNYFEKEEIKRLFSIVGHNSKNSIEVRLKRAIIWIGKGILSNSSIESIINYCSALESILVRDSKAFISPSIVYSLSEYCAFLLGTSQSDRKEIIKKVKEIYSARSAGTHGGKLYTNAKIEKTALELSLSMVYRLIKLHPKQIKNEKELIDYIDKIKFS